MVSYKITYKTTRKNFILFIKWYNKNQKNAGLNYEQKYHLKELRDLWAKANRNNDGEYFINMNIHHCHLMKLYKRLDMRDVAYFDDYIEDYDHLINIIKGYYPYIKNYKSS